jgi:diguanylate cyclase (GGDEF)-like protein
MLNIIEGYFLNSEMKKQLSVLVIDIDHFKKVNDTYGHDAGDQVIVRVAEVIKGTLRKGDHVARWGGEEFLVITTSTNADNTILVAENIRKSVAKEVIKYAEHELNITVSIGAENCLPDDCFNSIFDRADKSLYEAKKTGRNKSCSSTHKTYCERDKGKTI